ncbi:unnamed protein product, partial [Mesorhabditis spiculigera]
MGGRAAASPLIQLLIFCILASCGLTAEVCRDGVKQLTNTNGTQVSDECCDGFLRDRVKGVCSPCPLGWTGRVCDQPCSKGFFGPACQHPCEDCAACDRFSGKCEEYDWSKAWADGRLFASIVTILLICLAVAILSMAIAYTMFYRRRRSQSSREERTRITSDVDAPAEAHPEPTNTKV